MSFDWPSYDSEWRKRYILRLLLMFVEMGGALEVFVHWGEKGGGGQMTYLGKGLPRRYVFSSKIVTFFGPPAVAGRVL